MSTLSWFIYFADVLHSFALTLGIVTTFGVVIWVAVCITFSDQGDHHYWKHLAWFILPVILSLSIPSKNTLYAIAASEFGETIIKSETAGKVHQALNAWLVLQIKELKK